MADACNLYPARDGKMAEDAITAGGSGLYLGALLTKALVVRAFLLPGISWAAAAAIGAGCGILGPLGDLSESMLKRAFDKKDSSHILPGHGGLLDRIDALLFNAPFVWLCARILQHAP